MDHAKLVRDYEAAHDRGDLIAELAILRQVLSLSQQSGGSQAEPEIMRRIGNVLQEQGQLQKAHDWRIAAAKCADDPRYQSDRRTRAAIEGDLGRSFIAAMDWPKAEEHTRRALEMASMDIAETCILKVNLGLVLAKTGKMSLAFALAEEVLQQAENLGPEQAKTKHYILALQHANLAGFLLSEFRLNDCQRHARRALAHADRVPSRPLRLQAEQVIGECYTIAKLVTGRDEYAENAERRLHSVIAAAVSAGNFVVAARAEWNLARYHEYRRQPTESLEHYQKAQRLLEEVRSRLGYEEFQLTYFSGYEGMYSDLAGFLLREGRPEEAFTTVEQLRSRLLLRLLGEGPVGASSLPEPQRESLSSILDDYGRGVVTEVFGVENPAKSRGVTVGRLLRGEADSIEGEWQDALHKRFTQFYDGARLQRGNWAKQQWPDVADANAARALLGPSDALISYLVDEESVIIFALTNQGSCFEHLNYRREDVRRDVEAIGVCLGKIEEEVLGVFQAESWFGRKAGDPLPRSVQRLLAELNLALERTFALMVAPVLHHIACCSHWIFVPSGPLHALPWAALRMGGEYVIQRHTVSLLPSASVGVVLRKRTAVPNGDALFFGDPDPDNSALSLPESRREVDVGFRTLDAGPPPFLGAEATKCEFLRRASTARLIHLACHHVFNCSVPLLSFLKLAGNRGRDYLYAFEIAELRLDAQLVCLSACQSGRSRVEAGDEQYGIVRAFLGAGAQSVISTLWSVEDESAADFFQTFYRAAKLGSMAAALAEAQRALLLDPRFELPCFWAPYVLSGRWELPLGSVGAES